VNEGRHTVLSELAKSEDISEFAEERRTQDKALHRGEKLTDEERTKWFQRTNKALTDAAAQAAAPNAQKPAPIPPSYQSGAQQDTAQWLSNQGASAERVNQYLRGNEEKRQNIISWHESMDPTGSVADWIIANNSSMAGPIMERCADNPEALRLLAEMPSHERSRWLSKLEGHLEAEQRIGAQMAQQQQQWQQEQSRHISRAPPPIPRMPGGGANPPSNIHSLAQKDSIADYVRARKAMKDL
jgi:hypothetical protein